MSIQSLANQLRIGGIVLTLVLGCSPKTQKPRIETSRNLGLILGETPTIVQESLGFRTDWPSTSAANPLMEQTQYQEVWIDTQDRNDARQNRPYRSFRYSRTGILQGS